MPIGSPLPRQTCLHSTDPGETIARVGKLLAPHRMELGKNARLDTRFFCLEMASAKIADIRYGTNATIVTNAPPEYFLLHNLIDGESTIEVEGRAAVLTPDTIVISQPGEHIKIRFSPESRHLTALISRPSLEAYMRDHLSIPITAALEFNRDRPLTGKWIESWRGILQIAMQSAGGENVFRGDISTPVSDLMLNLITANCPHNYSKIQSSVTLDAPWYVRRACLLVEKSLRESADHVAVAELAKAVGVGIRSLQFGFRDHLGISVSDYIRERRLEVLDRALRYAGRNATVASVMFDCGITSQGRYASYYKNRFGRLPAAALRRS